ncbi:competence damage-inducible protein A [Schleiferilactobacillus perolens DSM 12744]|uniref:Putative competence-damage inducible protein n=2 Tax=Schleiferilactobacillus perolens TaxID=100468 RepID=A0A0R1MZ98_9LACO|nr:competence damage-inducible protein A [Schleiferilactobacillus perolens DSM 12744]
MMKAEIIAVGTEMLLGEITDTNTPYLARQLAQLGIDMYYQNTVGDNPARITGLLAQASQRSDLIVLMGGLGPTADDVTKQTLTSFLKRPLVTDAAAEQKLHEQARRLQHALTANNYVQAQLPADSIPLANRTGLAVGSWTAVDGRVYVTLPGPPQELRPMVSEQLIPLLAKQTHHVLASRMLRFFGLTESVIATRLAEVIDAQTNPTIAIYYQFPDIAVRITARAQDTESAERILQPVVRQVQTLLGDAYYGEGEHNSLAQVVGNELIHGQHTITAAESLTAGEFQATLGSVPGISAVFPGGFVTYAAAQKTAMIGVPADTIQAHGVVSAETAQAMAEGAKRQVGTEYALGFTGVAGPDNLEEKPAGTVFIGLAGPAKTVVREFHLIGSRNEVRARAVAWGFKMLQNNLPE